MPEAGKGFQAPAVDEQGDLWPPPFALVAFVQNYGGSPSSKANGQLVEIGGYVPECLLFETSVIGSDHEMLPVLKGELLPLNDYTKEFIEKVSEAAIPMYDDAVYDLRDRLSKIGVQVTAESIDRWSAKELDTIIEFLDSMDKFGDNQENLVRYINDGKLEPR